MQDTIEGSDRGSEHEAEHSMGNQLEWLPLTHPDDDATVAALVANWNDRSDGYCQGDLMPTSRLRCNGDVIADIKCHQYGSLDVYSVLVWGKTPELLRQHVETLTGLLDQYRGPREHRPRPTRPVREPVTA